MARYLRDIMTPRLAGALAVECSLESALGGISAAPPNR